MDKRLIFIFVATTVVTVFGAITFFWTNSLHGEIASPQHFFGIGSDDEGVSHTQHKVNLSIDGFDPKELTVKQGDTVIFSTTRDHFFWPASNIHPTHEIYSAFDPKEPIDPIDKWSFQFNQIGRWEYHDHLSPYFVGVIIVNE